MQRILRQCLSIGLTAILLTTLLSSTPVLAEANTKPNTFVATGWSKGDFKFDVVVGDKPDAKLFLYVDDLNNYSATVNKQGWATFKKVALSGKINQDNTTGKISFTRVIDGKQKPINYTQRYTASSNKVGFSDLFIHPTGDVSNVTNGCDSTHNPYVTIAIRNHSTHSMSYDITVAALDSSGKQVGSVEGVFSLKAEQYLPFERLYNASGSCGVSAQVKSVDAYDPAPGDTSQASSPAPSNPVPTNNTVPPPAPVPSPVPANNPTPAPAPSAPCDGYINVDGNCIASPSSNPAGATAQCNDGTYSYSQHRSGTCSRHGGVGRWL
jgi:hypothetical protein